jgi:hypothetical protein
MGLTCLFLFPSLSPSHLSFSLLHQRMRAWILATVSSHYIHEFSITILPQNSYIHMAMLCIGDVHLYAKLSPCIAVPHMPPFLANGKVYSCGKYRLITLNFTDMRELAMGIFNCMPSSVHSYIRILHIMLPACLR